jgi:hypothetical protein
MSVTVRLSEDQYYLIYELEEPLEIKELMAAYDQEREYRDSIPHTLHSIVDMSKVKRIPPNWLVAKAGPGLTHARSGYMLFVGVSYGLRIMVQIILKITKYERIHFFESREEAETYMTELVQKTKASELPASNAH